MTEIAKYPAGPESPQGVPTTETPYPGSYATPGYATPGYPTGQEQQYGGYQTYQQTPPPYGMPPGGQPPYGTPPTTNDHRSPNSPWYKRTAVIVAAVAVLAGTAGGVAGAAMHSGGGTTVVSSLSSSGSGTAASVSSSTIAKVAAAVTPSVVEIQVTGASESDIGSGVILSSTGLILTNNHVVAAATSANGGGTVKIVFSNGKTANATIVKTDSSSDLALVKAQNVSGLTVASLGDSSTVQVGDTVLAIGSPEGLQNTVTSGIVSALNRSVTVSTDTTTNQYDPFSNQTNTTVTYSAIQTDASLNPGNSGGPLINLQGQVVGINSAIYSPTSAVGGSSGGSVGLGFSIPINKVKEIVSQMETSSGVSS